MHASLQNVVQHAVGAVNVRVLPFFLEILDAHKADEFCGGVALASARC